MGYVRSSPFVVSQQPVLVMTPAAQLHFPGVVHFLAAVVTGLGLVVTFFPTHLSSRHSQSPLHQEAPLPCGQPPQPVIDLWPPHDTVPLPGPLLVAAAVVVGLVVVVVVVFVRALSIQVMTGFKPLPFLTTHFLSEPDPSKNAAPFTTLPFALRALQKVATLPLGQPALHGWAPLHRAAQSTGRGRAGGATSCKLAPQPTRFAHVSEE